MSDVCTQVEATLHGAIEGARARVTMASPGHYEIEVVAPAFAGKSRLESQRLVLSSIKQWMAGADAPVHAVDRIVTRAE